MFGLFKQKSPSAPATPFGEDPVTDLGPRRMNLEERKQVRREMVYQSMRENLQLLDIGSDMYKFKAVGLDERQHRFMVVMDVATGFIARRDGKVMRLNDVETFLTERTFSQYGVRVDAIYWRFHPGIADFSRAGRSVDSGKSAVPKAAPVVQTPARSVKPVPRHESISDEERRAFQQAIAHGVKPPPLHLGDLEYQSDLAPLESQPPSDGSQYGAP